MRISVALCTYNGSRFLPEQLFSISRQRRLPDEVVICDDCSTDGTMAAIERFADEAGFPVHIHKNEQNLRATKNFEKAIGLCQGDVIVTADQDDVWYPDKLAKTEQAFAAPDVGLVFSDADLIDGDGRPRRERLWTAVRFTPGRLAALQRGEAFMTVLRRSAVTGATMAFRAGLRDLILPIPEAWIHDDWIALLVAADDRVVAIEEPLIQYRLHDDNQVGVGDGTPTVQVAVQGIFRDSFLIRVDRLMEAREALARGRPARLDRQAQIDGQIAHFRARARLPASRLARIPGVADELIRLRYTRYSGTTMAFLRDLASSS